MGSGFWVLGRAPSVLRSTGSRCAVRGRSFETRSSADVLLPQPHTACRQPNTPLVDASTKGGRMIEASTIKEIS